jgi:hypothetical protein
MVILQGCQAGGCPPVLAARRTLRSTRRSSASGLLNSVRTAHPRIVAHHAALRAGGCRSERRQVLRASRAHPRLETLTQSAGAHRGRSRRRPRRPDGWVSHSPLRLPGVLGPTRRPEHSPQERTCSAWQSQTAHPFRPAVTVKPLLYASLAQFPPGLIGTGRHRDWRPEEPPTQLCLRAAARSQCVGRMAGPSVQPEHVPARMNSIHAASRPRDRKISARQGLRLEPRDLHALPPWRRQVEWW